MIGAMTGEMHFDRAMNDSEGLMWRLEKDPHLSATYAGVSILDRAPDPDTFRRKMEHVVAKVPRLRQRVLPSPANLSPPTWVEDTEFSLDRHVRRIACPKPGTVEQAIDLAKLMIADPFDRTRPLWQFVIVEGLRGGKAAFITKMHHTITDGERGVELSMEYFDLEPDAPELPPLDVDSEPSPPPEMEPIDPLRHLISSGLRIPASIARQVRDLLADPGSLPEASSAASRTLQGIVSQLSDTEAAHSPLWTARSLDRHVEILRTPFRPTKDASKKLGGTLNTAFLTAATDAAANYHLRLGSPVDTLRASMAISTRTDDSGGNAFSIARLLVPTGEMPIADRFHAVRESSFAAREASLAGGTETLAALSSVLPTSLVTRLARQQAQTIDFATSNVRGAREPVYLAGAQVLAIYPIGPLVGVAFNLTLMSYLGSLDMAMHIDTAAVAEPALLAECLDDAFKRLAEV